MSLSELSSQNRPQVCRSVPKSIKKMPKSISRAPKSTQESHKSAPRLEKALNINLGTLLGHSRGPLGGSGVHQGAPKGSPRGSFFEDSLEDSLELPRSPWRLLGKWKTYFTIYSKRTPWGGRRFRSDPTVFFKLSRLPRSPSTKNPPTQTRG